jgi:hypothetical protein
MRRAHVVLLAVAAGVACSGDGGTQPTPDYSLSLAPGTLTVEQTASGSLTITITPTNFSGDVSFSLANAPAGVAGVFAPVSAAGTSATLTLSVGATVVAGGYTLTVMGNGAPGARSAQLTLTVIATGDFSLAVAPESLTVLQGGSGSAAVTITRTGFAGAVTLSLSNAPLGVTGSFSPPVPTGVSSALVVNVGTTPPATYQMSVAGTSSVGTRSAPLVLTVANPCAVLVPLPGDTTVNGTLTTFDCQFNGPFFTDFYSVALSGQAGLQVTMSATFDTYLEQYHVTGPFIAVNDDMDSTSLDSRINVIAAAGTYVFAATSFSGNVTGPYSLTVAPRPQALTGCRGEPFLTWVTRGVAIADAVQATDCITTRTGGGRAYSDRVLITLTPTSPLTATLTSGAFNPRLELYAETQTGPSLVTSADGVSGTATLTHTPVQPAVFRLEITAVDTIQTGAYTLTLTGPAPGVAEVVGSAPVPTGRLGAVMSKARTRRR